MASSESLSPDSDRKLVLTTLNSPKLTADGSSFPVHSGEDTICCWGTLAGMALRPAIISFSFPLLWSSGLPSPTPHPPYPGHPAKQLLYIVSLPSEPQGEREKHLQEALPAATSKAALITMAQLNCKL